MDQTPAASEKTLRPTKKQKELLAYIEQFIAENGYSPSYREIMSGLEYTSVATVALHVGNLISRGHLRKREHSARSPEVVTPSAEFTSEPKLKTNEVKPSEEKWLIEKVEHLFSEAEGQAVATEEDLRPIEIMLAALRVLGLEAGAQSFTERYQALKGQGKSSE